MREENVRRAFIPKAPGYYDDPRTEMVGFVPPSASTVLDVGCGAGGFGRSLGSARSARAPTIWGIEPFSNAAAAAGDAYDRIVDGVFPADLPADAPAFDCIVFNDVLEHLVDPWNALSRASELLTPDGVVVASIPNVRCYPVVRMLTIDGEWRYQRSGVMDQTHLRFFTAKTIRRLFEDTGFRIERIEPVEQMDNSARLMRVARTLRLDQRQTILELTTLRFGVTARRR